MQRHAIALLSALCLGFTSAPALAQADDYPNKPVRVVIPYGPGGLTDVIGRLVLEEVRTILGQNMIVDNKPGGTGIIAIREVARAKPDGYTIMIGNVSTNGLTPILLAKRLELDYNKSISTIARLADTPAVLIANINFPPKTFKEFLEHARKNPDMVRYGSAGIGAYQQINTEHLSLVEGLKMNHIPIKGGGSEIMRDLLSGDLNVTFFNMANSHALVKDGRIRAYAITTDERHPVLPDVPTMAELGYKNVGVTQWTVAFAPAGVPVAILEKLNVAFNKALKSPRVQEAYAKAGIVTPPPNSLKEAEEWVRKDQERMRKIVQDIGLKIE